MASGGPTNVDVFEVRKVRRLVELMNEHDLAEIDLRQGNQRIRLRRGQDPAMVVAAPVAPQAIPQPAGAIPAGTVLGAEALSVEGAKVERPASEDDQNVIYITSPMVGTYYSASSPDAASYAKVGDQVGPESVVCIIEAMKVFNEIPAECSGKIVSVLVDSGDAVEFGQKLFKLEKIS